MATPLLRNLPSINELLESAPLKAVSEQLSRNVVVGNVRSFLENLRTEVQRSAAEIKLPTGGELAERIAEWILHRQEQGPQPAINATGVVLHPRLEIPLAPAALAELQAVCSGYSSTLGWESDEPCSRGQGEAEGLLRQLTGAEAALVLNTPSAGLLLALSTLAAGKEVIVARGELVAQADDCRLTDLIAAAGATLRETGASNRVTAADYLAAARPESAAILRVHPLQMAMVGDASSVALEEIITAARRRHLPVIVDLGNGGACSIPGCNACGETDAAAAIAAGADLVLLRGNRLLGGPACGVIVGRRQWIDRLSEHPLATSSVASRLTLAALTATLRLYADKETVSQQTPVSALLSCSPENLKNRAERLAPQLAAAGCCASAEVVETTAWLTGEPIAAHQLPSWAVAITPASGDAASLAAQLQKSTPPLVARLSEAKLLIDLRSVLPSQDSEIARLVQELSAPQSKASPAASDSAADSATDPREHDIGQ